MAEGILEKGLDEPEHAERVIQEYFDNSEA